MNKYIFVLVFALALSGGLFYLIHLFTVTPGTISGNGNIAILFMMPLPILFLVSIYCWYHLFKKVTVRPSLLVGGLLLLATGITAGIMYQRQRFYQYREYLFDVHKEIHGLEDWEYILDITSGGIYSPHVNNQFFNLNTYLIYIACSLLLSILIVIVIRARMNRKQKLQLKKINH